MLHIQYIARKHISHCMHLRIISYDFILNSETRGEPTKGNFDSTLKNTYNKKQKDLFLYAI